MPCGSPAPGRPAEGEGASGVALGVLRGLLLLRLALLLGPAGTPALRGRPTQPVDDRHQRLELHLIAHACQGERIRPGRLQHPLDAGDGAAAAEIGAEGAELELAIVEQRIGRIDRIGSLNERIQLINFWPNMELEEYINLEQRVSGRMVLLDISATGEENIIEHQSGNQMNDLEYRRKQLLKLQDAVIDLDDVRPAQVGRRST